MILALVLSWAAVVLDCPGKPEVVIYYTVHYGAARMANYPACPNDDQGKPQECIEWTDGTMTTPGLMVTLPDPGVDQVTAWEDPVTWDWALNSSEECP